jgi:hypothetical protein
MKFLLMVFFGPSRQMPICYPQLGHDYFLSHSFKYVIHLSYHLKLSGLNLNEPGCGPVMGSNEHGNESSGSIRGEYLDQLGHCQLLLVCCGVT